MKETQTELSYRGRCLRTRTGMLLFGPTGRRLAVDVLERRPGFRGCIDFIHKMNVTELFTIEDDRQIDYSQADVVWYPDRMTLTLDGDISFYEEKTISADDTAISVMRWENHTKKPLTLRFICCPEGFQTQKEDGRSAWFAKSPVLRFGIVLGISAGWDCEQEKAVVLPGESIRLTAAASVGNLISETEEEIRERRHTWEAWKDQAAKQARDGQNRFFEEAPAFSSSDRLMDACWKYRWYILKNSICYPEYGNFREAVMYEGRDHRMAKTALSPGGWEFSKLIPLSTPLQITDMRWHSDRSLTKELIRSAFAGQDEDGLLLCTYVDQKQKSYANYMLWAIWLFYLTDGETEWIRELIPAMKKYIAGHEKKYQNPPGSLLTERTHSLTGKEYQPSYWYFHNFPKNPKDPAGFTPLKRVDRSVYHYLNLTGLANLLKALGEDGSEYEKKAQALKQEINDRMWDEETGFYYDLHDETGEKAMVRNIVGIYPYWAEMAAKGNERGILPLMDREAFATGSVFATVSRDCPAFSPSGGWMGNYIKGRNGCVWCGPSWPYTNGIALEALGNESRKQNHQYDAAFDRFLKEYTIQHFRDGDYRKPYLVEHYDAVSGERLSDEADYNHSFWLDLVISYVAGIRLTEDGIILDPIRTHLKWFRLEHLNVRGHRIGVSRAQEDDLPCGKGITVSVDGKKMMYTEEELPVFISLTNGE